MCRPLIKWDICIFYHTQSSNQMFVLMVKKSQSNGTYPCFDGYETTWISPFGRYGGLQW
jgi:hypothetical protein